MGLLFSDDDVQTRAAAIANLEGIEVLDLSDEEIVALARRAKLELLDENYVPGTCGICCFFDPDLFSLILRKKVHSVCHTQLLEQYSIGPGVKMLASKGSLSGR